MYRKYVITCLVAVAGAACQQQEKKVIVTTAPQENFIVAPIPAANIPYKEFQVDALKGDTLFYETGSIILLPPNAFVDKDGSIIKGSVQVKYREFSNPIDFYLSGIPMDYDSAGTTYPFESSGMCEVLAFQNGKPVFVNPKNKPEINMVSNNNSPAHNIYYLDTVQKRWINKGSSLVNSVSKRSERKSTRLIATKNHLMKPVKPTKADKSFPVIKIVIDPASFEELAMYDDLEFQIDRSEKNFNPEDSSYEWNNVELQKGKQEGLYKIKFSNAEKTVSYVVRPVLEGDDYDKAMSVFEKKNAEYERKITERLNYEKAAREQFTQDSIANKRRIAERANYEAIQKEKYIADSLEYDRITEQNKQIEKLNMLIVARNNKINLLIDVANREMDKQNKRIQEMNQSNEIMRSFEIEGFGIWNCDRPLSQDYFLYTAKFKDESNSTIYLSNVAVLYKSLKVIQKFNNNRIIATKSTEIMIIGIYDGRFAYITFEDYRKHNISATTNQETFVMQVVAEKDNNYAFIKKIAGF